MALMPPVSAMKRHHGAARGGAARAGWTLAVVVGAGEDDAGNARVLDEGGTDLAGAGQQLQHVARHAGLVQQLHWRGRR